MLERQYISEVILSQPVKEDSYLSTLPVVRHLSECGSLSLGHSVTFFVGENGTGKSTLLEAIAVAFGFNPEGGTKNFNFATSGTHSELFRHITLAKSKFPQDGFFLRAESFYNTASYIEALDREPSALPPLIESYGGVSLHKQSHGESFLSLVQNRFGGKGVYILDEPEAALSPSRLLVLMAEMQALVEKDSQFIIATHSPILMTFPGAEIYAFSQEGVASVSYRETEHYQLTRRFLENPEQILRYLFE
ncbi:MAG: AAA family ATPase [Oscillospiraceae bacterium]|jgi:predicted ATPase|nr:AAA family ATPase [Oscillospiraceae bacterium]